MTHKAQPHFRVAVDTMSDERNDALDFMSPAPLDRMELKSRCFSTPCPVADAARVSENAFLFICDLSRRFAEC